MRTTSARINASLTQHEASALTIIQMLFIAAHSLPVVLGSDGRLKPRNVPLHKWAAQVLCLTAMSLLNNWVFLFHVPVTVQIVFRSAGLLVSMAFNYLFNGKRYNAMQIVRASFVSCVSYSCQSFQALSILKQLQKCSEPRDVKLSPLGFYKDFALSICHPYYLVFFLCGPNRENSEHKHTNKQTQAHTNTQQIISINRIKGEVSL